MHICIIIAGIAVKMAQCWTNYIVTRCNRLALNSASLVHVNWTVSHHCQHFVSLAKLTISVGANDCVSAGKNLLRPFFGVFRHEYLFRNCAYISSASWSRTVQSSNYFYPEANWVRKSRLLSSFRDSSDVLSQRALNRFSALSKSVHDSRTIGLSRCTTTKHFQKWSISGVVRQLVYSLFVHFCGVQFQQIFVDCFMYKMECCLYLFASLNIFVAESGYFELEEILRQ